jgi:protein associated with RNAse G/E
MVIESHCIKKYNYSHSITFKIYNQANKIQKWQDLNQPQFMYTPITYDYIGNNNK